MRLLRERLAEIVPYNRWRLSAVDAMPKALLFVVVYDGGGLRVEDGKTLRERLDIVV